MPSGYTADIEKDISFEDFVLGCARAFGACIMQRDDSAGDKPKLREEDTYYAEKLPEELAFLGYLQSLDDAQQEEFGNEERDKEISRIRGKLDATQALLTKYQLMAEKVGAWEPPTPNHVNLKEFMTGQIVESINFDCDTSYYTKLLQAAVTKTPLDFYQEALKNAEWQCDHYENQLNESRIRVKEANDWIIQLYKSLGREI
jgi:hypothetical protein